MELIGPQLRVSGSVDVGTFPRLSDFMAAHAGAVRVHDAVILNRRGMPTAETMETLHLRLEEVSLIGQRRVPELDPPSGDVFIDKWRQRVTIVTAAHVLDATVSLYPGADAVAYLEAPDPPFVPLQHVSVRWVQDRRLRASFPFALLHRRAIVAVALVERSPAGVGGAQPQRPNRALGEIWNPDRSRAYSPSRGRRAARTGRDQWSGRRGSNPRHPPWEGGTLPTELLPRAPDSSIRRQQGQRPDLARSAGRVGLQGGDAVAPGPRR